MPNVEIGWLRDYVNVESDSPAELAKALVKVGIEEEQINSPELSGPIKVAKVLSMVAEPQKNGKIINWCQVDAGETDETGERKVRGIVCGAHNFTAGDYVVVSLPGAVLPGGFQISARKTYGHISDGMICSAPELGFDDPATKAEDGIIVLPRLGYAVNDENLGDDATSLLGLDVSTLEVNITPDRGYCFSYRGIAREYAHSTGQVYTDPVRALIEKTPLQNTDSFVDVRDKNACSRFAARLVRGLSGTQQSPAWLQQRLRRAGVRPISLIVDTANYIMLSLGQPLHTYDFDTLKLPIGVRLAKPDEELRTLDGKLRKLCGGDDIVITDSDDNAIGLAGVMGGLNTEVTDSTTNVLIEAANFEQFHIARTARRHKLHSEAAFRSERGIDTNLPAAAAQAAVDLLVKYGSGVVDDAVQDANFVKPREAIEYKTSTTSRLLGIYLTTSKVRELLEEIGCEVKTVDPLGVDPLGVGRAGVGRAGADLAGIVSLGVGLGSLDEVLSVTPPSWRPDLTIEADLAEEIARLSGYDKIPSFLPSVTSSGDNKLPKSASFKRLVSNYLASNSLVEVLSYPFVGESELEMVVLPGLDASCGDGSACDGAGVEGAHGEEAHGATAGDATPTYNTSTCDTQGVEAVELENPLSKDKPYLRTALLQSLLETANRNVRRGNAGIQLFEVGKVFIPNEYTNSSRSHLLGGFRPDDSQLYELNRGLPYQPIRLAGVFTGNISPKTYSKNAVFADYKNAFSAAKDIINLAKIDAAAYPEVPDFFHPGRSAKYAVTLGDGTQKVIGYAGELHPNVINKLHLPKRTSVFEFSLDLLFELSAKTEVQAKPISTYPAVKEDFAFVVDIQLPAAKLIGVAKESVGDILEDINIFDVFESGAIGEGKKSIAFSVKIRPQEKTFDENDIHAVRECLISSIEGELGAELRS